MIQEQRGGARAFVRSLNILLKFARLYEFGHARTSAQFETAWTELRGALDDSGGGRLVLGPAGNPNFFDRGPPRSAPRETSTSPPVSSSGTPSISFFPTLPP